jgi:RNA polymerase sigma-70 factor (ECF subfamily)
MISFHDLYEQYAPEVYRFAYWLAGNAMEADDITSETFVRAWAHRSRIRTATVKAYLFTIARNYYLEGQQKAKRLVALDENHADRRPAPDKVVADRVALEDVQGLIQQLAEEDRTVFLLRVQHELPYAEIARITELSLSAVKVKVHRARLKVAALQMQEEVL